MVASEYVSYEGYMFVPYRAAREFIVSPRVLVRKDVRDRLGEDCRLCRYMLVRVTANYGWVGLPMVYAMSEFYENMLDAVITLNDEVQRWNEQHITFSADHSASGAVAYEIWEIMPGSGVQSNEWYMSSLAEWDALVPADHFSRFFRSGSSAARSDISLSDYCGGVCDGAKAAGSLLVYFGGRISRVSRVSGVRCLLCGDDCGPWVTRYALKPHDEPYYLCESCESLDRTLTMLFEAGER